MSPNFCCNQAEWGPPPACQLRSLQNSPHAHIFRWTTQHCRSRRPNRCRADEIQCHLGQDSISFHQNWFYEHPQFQFQYLAPFHPFLNPIEEVFFLAWGWKVYQPYVRISLIQAMKEACGSVQGWIHHLRIFFPHCCVRTKPLMWAKCYGLIQLDKEIYGYILLYSIENNVLIFSAKCNLWKCMGVLTDFTMWREINVFINVQYWSCVLCLVNM